MPGYLIFIISMLVIMGLSNLIIKNGFKEFYFYRQVDKEKIFPNEVINITNIIENKKILPILFLVIRENYPKGLYRIYGENNFSIANTYKGTYSIGVKERLKRTYSITAYERGVYTLRMAKITIGDIFGFSSKEKDFEDFKEIIVYPKFNNIRYAEFNNNSIQGDEIVKRWIYKDPIYIKGIREYTLNDRMKDIHWNSSVKMNNLMVKEYDTTSEKKIKFILNTDNSKMFWIGNEKEFTEKSINFIMAMSENIIKKSISVSIGTNAYIISGYKEYKNQTVPYTTNFMDILEFGSRIDYNSRYQFKDYLEILNNNLDKNTVYVIIACYIDDISLSILSKLSRIGYIIKIIDMSPDGLPIKHSNIEVLKYRGGC